MESSLSIHLMLLLPSLQVLEEIRLDVVILVAPKKKCGLKIN